MVLKNDIHTQIMTDATNDGKKQTILVKGKWYFNKKKR